MAVGLQATNLSAGQTVALETSNLPGGALQLVGVEGSSGTGRFLLFKDARTDAGLSLTGTAGSGAMAVARTVGTSFHIVGETTSASTVTDKVIWELDLPDTYAAGAPIPVSVESQITGAGTIVAASCTQALAAFSEVNGVEAALTVTGGTQQMVAAGGALAWSVAGTGLTPGSHIVLEITQVVDSSSGSNTGQINSASFQA
jgi:hypothetical protein